MGPPRATTDLDLVVVGDYATLVVIAAVLRSLGYAQVREQRAEPGDPLPDIVVYKLLADRPRDREDVRPS